jgi:general secretion pathway protein D
VVQALKQLTNARLLADPTVTVIDREKASIQIVTEIPYQQLTQTGNGGNIGTTAFREAGVTLSVSPKIANDGTLQLDVTPTFSRLAGFTQGPLPAPIIDKREASTTVRVADGQTLVIGGLRQRSDTRERRGVPYLKDRKYVGPLFRARNDTVRESELVVFITSEIVMPANDRSRPREWAAESRVRRELERIPVAPEMVWPNAFPQCEAEYVDGRLIHPHADLREPGVSAGAVEELVIPEVTPPAPSSPTPPLNSDARWLPSELMRLPDIESDTNAARTATRQTNPSAQDQRSGQPDQRGLLQRFFR